MPVRQFKMPDGQTRSFNIPDGATSQQVEEFLNGEAGKVANAGTARRVANRPPVDAVPGDAAPPPPPADQPDASNGMNAIGASMGRGFVKGATETVGNALKYSKGLVRGDFGEWDDPDFQREVASSEEAHGLAEGIGKFGERVVEFVAGDAAATAGLKALGLTAKTLPLAIRAGARILKGAAVGGGVTAVQGGDATAGAVLGAGGEAAGVVVDAAAKPLAKGAQTLYTRFLNPTKQANKLRTLDIVDEALERGIQGSLGDVATQAAEGKAGAIGQLDETYAKFGDVKVKAEDVKTSLETAKADHVIASEGGGDAVAMSREDRKAVRIIDGFKEVIDKASTDGEIDINRLRKIRKAWYDVASGPSQSGITGAKNLEQTVHANAADSLREIINTNMPPEAMIDKINAEYTFWKKFEKVASDTIVRKSTQQGGLGEQFAAAGGMTAGLLTGHGLGGKAISAIVEGQLTKLFVRAASSGKLQSRAAVLANAIARGHTAKVGAILRSVIQAGGSVATDPSGEGRDE